jgi:hypothetical protein
LPNNQTIKSNFKSLLSLGRGNSLLTLLKPNHKQNTNLKRKKKKKRKKRERELKKLTETDSSSSIDTWNSLPKPRRGVNLPMPGGDLLVRHTSSAVS